MYQEIENFLKEFELIAKDGLNLEKFELEFLNNIEHFLFKVWDDGYQKGLRDGLQKSIVSNERKGTEN